MLKISSVYGEEASQYGDNHETVAHDDKEKIFVTVTLSPLNEMEVTNNDLLDWECINNAIILYKNSISEFSSTPNAYAYGKLLHIFIFLCLVFLFLNREDCCFNYVVFNKYSFWTFS